MKRKVHILLTVLMLTLVMGFTVYADEFSISQTKATINVGDTIDLDISGADKAPRWTSYNVNIARVNGDGEVTAVRKGKTTISARVGLTYKKCSVSVVDTSIKLNKKAATIYAGGTSTNTVQLKATAKGTSKSVSWNSDNTAVATVDGTGKVTSVSAGTATITATANGKTEICKITVLDSSIALNMSNLQLSTKGSGSSIKITPTVIGSNKSVKWTSSDNTVAKVSSGKVTGRSNGTAVITATANGISATCNVTVVEGLISINSEKELLYTGESKQLKTNAAKTDAVSWNSSNTSVATVSNGKITAVGAGTSVISVQCNGKADTCEVTVKDTATIIGEDAVELKTKGTNKTYTLGYEVIGRKPNVKWTTSNASVATASNGKITAKKAGTAIITATANGVSDSVQVTVKDFDPTIKLDQNEYTLYTGKGDTLTLKATVDGASKSVSWRSSDSSVATVTNGKVKAVKEGQALVTATANGVTADCTITVKESRVILETENINLNKGDTAKLPVDVVGTSQSVKYATTNSKIVTVKNGVVTAKNYGEADIKVTANGITAICHINVSDCTHTFDAGKITKESTCSEEGIKTFTCSKCGYSYTESIEKKEHKWSETSREESCENNGIITYTCSVCNETKQETTKPIGHSYGEWSVVTEPTETTEGLEKQSCIRCGAENTRTIPTKAHVHKYVDTVVEPTCTEEGCTTHTCKCGDTYKDTTVAALGHDWSEWVITKEPTEKEKGEKKHTCNRCKAEETAEISETSHEHEYTATVVEPTCTEQGYTTYTCECGATYNDDYKDALGHAWGEWITTKEPTETEAGEKKHICERCKAEETDTIPKTEHIHKYTEVVTKPTCTEQGYTTYTCECGESYVDNYTDALGHEAGDWEVGREATCTLYGWNNKCCIRCNTILEQENIPALGHDYKDVITKEPTCTEDGLEERKCTRCGEVSGKSTIKSSHTWGDWTVTKEPSSGAVETTDDFGTRERTCTICGTKDEQTIVNIDVGNGETALVYGVIHDSEAYDTLALVNDLRTSVGENELEWYDPFEDICKIRSAEISYKWGHERPNGDPQVSYKIDEDLSIGLGENIAMGARMDNAQEVFDLWKESSGHYANMVKSDYTKYYCSSFSIEKAGSTYWYWVQVFIGNPNASATSLSENGIALTNKSTEESSESEESSDEQTETSEDEESSDEQTETSEDEESSDEQTETSEDEESSDEQTETSEDEESSDEQTETSEDEKSSNEQTETFEDEESTEKELLSEESSEELTDTSDIESKPEEETVTTD